MRVSRNTWSDTEYGFTSNLKMTHFDSSTNNSPESQRTDGKTKYGKAENATEYN